MTRREEPSGSGGGGGKEGSVESRLGRLLSSRLLRSLNTSKVTGKVTSLVRGIERVDKGVDSGTVGARGNAGELVGDGVVGGESGSVGVVLEVTVGGIMGVDEGVAVGVDGLIDVVVVDGSGLLDGLRDDNGGGLGSGGGSSLFGVERSGVETVGTGGDVRAVEDSETVLTGSVLHGIGLTIITDITVLSNSLTGSSCLLSEHNAILLGVGGTESSVSGVESLFLEDFGVLGVNKLTGSCNSQTRCYDKL